ncbi:NUDIX hydrolase [Arthrobacter crystallopoietes BAB-32]|uniref:Oxidized purine nucleoside triphosphate hydrolase n=1 Tax=Arthrobacter crystallopoietes BAB-32 TaxID=1246476 RepID=N1UZ36_9MICC|nr:NUDIX domain-containing protein [Arthrobacter crystallopoietes]EMY33059.1 NUDIX hydrolase [Arthrobacter crystallopoietes BAB-32]
MEPIRVALCFLLREDAGVRSVLLGHKKTGFGTGKVVGVGGKLEPGEEAAEAACREVYEETGMVVRAESLVPAGRILFDFPFRPQLNMDTLLFTTRTWEGDPAESDEIIPQWYRVDALPLQLMWHDAGTWLPLALDGHGPNLRIILNEDNATVRAAVPLD